MPILTTASSTAWMSRQTLFNATRPTWSAKGPQQTSWSLSTTSPVRSFAGPRSCWRTRKTRRREVSCRIPAVLRYPCALDPDLSEGATSLSECCLGQSQYIDCSINWSLVKNSYGVKHQNGTLYAPIANPEM